MKSIGITVDASAFYPSLEPYYGQGDLPFLRVADVNSVIDFDGCTTIPDEVYRSMPTLAVAKPGDILFTKGGSIARVGILDRPAAVSRDLIFLNTSKLPRQEQIFLYLFFQTQFFKRSLIRSSSQTAQPHLTITLVRDLLSLKASERFKRVLLNAVDKTFGLLSSSADCIKQAESSLLNALALDSWSPPTTLSYVRSSRDVFTAGRFDAEHFQIQYEDIERKIKRNKGGYTTIRELARDLMNGAEVREYQDEGVAYLRVGDLKYLDINPDSVVRIDPVAAENGLEKIPLLKGDVLVSRSGSLAVTAVVEPEWEDALISSHLIRLRIEDERIDPYFLALFLSSLPGKKQILKWSNGGVQPEISQPSLSNILVPVIEKSIQKEIRKNILLSREARQNAERLLDAAKRAVEIAIEDSEVAALAYLKEVI